MSSLEQALRSHGQGPLSCSGIRTPTMERTLKLSQQVHKARNSLFWGGINGCVLAVLLFDILNTCPYYSSYIQIVEIIAAIFFSFNMIYHISCYIWNVASIQPVPLTPEQKKLLGVKESDPYFKTSTPVSSSSPSTTQTSSTPMNLSAVSWRSTSLMSSGGRSDSYSPNYTMSTASWDYYPGSAGGISITPNGSPRKLQSGTLSSLDQRAFSHTSSPSFVEDENSLNQYLKEYEAYEKSIGKGAVEEQQSTSFLSSIWKNSARVKADQTSLLRRCAYQLAPPTPPLKVHSPGGSADEVGSPISLQSQDVWRRVGINPNVLTQWNANLRMWLSQTVLERLVREIGTVDEAFQSHGLMDMRIGGVGLERLKKTAQMPQVMQNVPTLPRLVPFLEMTSNQEYLAARIRELAKGGSMSEFRWNGGGSMHGKEWEENLPTDSALLMYLLSTYLDTQLPPMPHNPDRRPFTSEYLVRAGDKVPEVKRGAPYIQELQVNSPHYIVVVSDERLDVGKGRNNFFHTVLLFIHQMAEKEGGMLGRVNLGASGINILWVIDR